MGKCGFFYNHKRILCIDISKLYTQLKNLLDMHKTELLVFNKLSMILFRTK